MHATRWREWRAPARSRRYAAVHQHRAPALCTNAVHVGSRAEQARRHADLICCLPTHQRTCCRRPARQDPQGIAVRWLVCTRCVDPTAADVRARRGATHAEPTEPRHRSRPTCLAMPPKLARAARLLMASALLLMLLAGTAVAAVATGPCSLPEHVVDYTTGTPTHTPVCVCKGAIGQSKADLEGGPDIQPHPCG